MENSNTLEPNEITLIRKARKNFLALAGAYFLGVFNDNFYKQAICLMAVSIGKSEFQGNATVLFALPFLLFAAPAGWFSDRYSKGSVVVWGKALEVVAMSAGAIGILYDSWSCIFAMLFIMAAQSTLVSPALNGAIPELYPKSYVTKANALVKLVSTSAILIGTAFAGPMLDSKSKSDIEPTYFFESSISEPVVLLETLQLKDDETSKLILAQIEPSILNLKKLESKNISEIISFQFQLLFDKLKTFLGGTPSIVDPKIELEKKVRQELLIKINKLIKDGKISEQIKNTEFYADHKAKIEVFANTSNDSNYIDALISRKYLEYQYSAHLKVIEITQTGKILIAIVIIFIALVGWLVSLGIPKLKAASPNKPFPIWGPIDTIKVVYNIRKDYLLAWTFLGSMFFYGIAGLIVLKVNSLGINQFHFNFMDTSILVVALLCGICLGSLIAGKISTDKIWFKLLPPALFIMGVFLTLIYFAPNVNSNVQYFFLFTMLVFTGIGGGIFIIPSESFCQTRPEPSRKGEILSAHNFIDFLGILSSGFIFYILEDLFPKHSNCMAFLGIVIIVLSIVFFIAFLNVTEKEINREGISQ